ncbi:spermidine synthase [Bradyrhizobium sp. USDA 4353]
MNSLALTSAALRASSPAMRLRLLHALFFLSGIPALIYQLTWQRSLFRIFGVNTESVTIVVTAFMLGLGLGSLFGGWLTRRRTVDALLVLGLIELSTAIFGVGSLSLFEVVGHLVLNWSLPAVAAVNLLLVLIPTLLMGATLPVLVSYLARTSGNVGSSVGTLYYVNTLGASLACLICAAVLFPFFGMHAAVWVAAAINAAVGAGALLARGNRMSSVVEPVPSSADRVVSVPVLGVLLASALAALGGFVSLSYEIFLFRVVSFASGSTSIAFALTLCAFLAGIAGGAKKAAETCDKRPPVEVRSRAVVDLIWANVFGALFLPLIAQASWIGAGVTGVAIAMVYVIARQWGALLPYLAHLGFAADGAVGMRAALLYCSNIVGCAAGSVLTGFILTDLLGLTQISALLLLLGCLCTLILAVAVNLAPSTRLRYGSYAILTLAVGLALLPLLADRVLENLQTKKISDHAFAAVVQNRSGIITVDADGTVFGTGMYDGRFNTDLKMDWNGIVRPYALSLFHPMPRDVLMIGLSSGSWAQVIANNPAVESLTIVEINKGYVELIAQRSEVKSLLNNPKVRIIQDDGRRWMVRNPERRFDAIVSNTTWHFRANATNLLSTEFLGLAKQHLNPQGVLFFNTTDSRRAQRTACLVFPYGARFTNHMVVSQAPIAFDYERWRHVLQNYSIDGEPLFNVSKAEETSKLDDLMDNYGPESSSVEHCPKLLQQTAGKAAMTDDNMGTEWRYYFALE